MKNYVGTSVKRREDPTLLRGQARYIDDVRLPGVLAVAFLRSPHAHARITGIDVSAALAMPGVEAAMTGADVGRHARALPNAMSNPTYRPTRWLALTDGTARFVGEPVVAIVARDRYRAEDAVDAVNVTWEPLPAVTEAEAALRPDAARVHDDRPDNVLFQARHDNGHVDAAFADAEVRLSATFRHGRCTGAPMEGRGAMASYDAGEGILTLWATTQAPHMLRSGLAEVLDMPESRIRVLCPTVGGGFGPKMHLYPEDVVVCLLARQVGRPVKWLEDRRENLLTCAQAREFTSHVEVAAARDGTILGFKAKIISDVGAYSTYPTTVALEPMTAAGIVPGPYRLRGYSYEAYAVATNKCPAGAYRGVGMALGTFVRERMIDMVARRTGIDPADIRRKNLVPPSAIPYTTASGLTIDNGDLPLSFERALEAADYETLKKERAAANGTKRRGIGIAAYTEFTGMGAGTFRRRGMTHVSGHDSATVRVEPTGEVRAFVSAVSQGQGHATTLAQVLADALSVPMSAVTVLQGDTERCPYGSGSFASRSMVVTGGALILAARRVRDKVQAIAAHLLEAAAADLVIDDGVISVRGLPSRRVTITDVARLAYRPASGTLPQGVDPALEATQYYDPPPATFSNGTHVAVVDVDVETGQVAIVRYVLSEDCGTMVNPMIVEGQVHGAVVQGIGNALFEHIVYDDAGQPLTTSFMDYLLPAAMELPAMTIVHVDTPPAVSVSGFKGMAEGGTIGATAAIANAVADALAPLGVEIHELPVSPDRIHRLIAGSRARTEQDVRADVRAEGRRGAASRAAAEGEASQRSNPLPSEASKQSGGRS